MEDPPQAGIIEVKEEVFAYGALKCEDIVDRQQAAVM